MSSQLLYNNDDLQDIILVLSFIEAFTESIGVNGAVMDTNIIERVVKSCKADFPHDGGVQRASAFKQVANFVCHFVSERPMLEPFFTDPEKNSIAKIENHQNAMVAFALAEQALNKSKIQRKDKECIVANPIEYSQHSYIDIIQALSNISAAVHFQLVSVLFEQLVYKTNPDCQYQTIK
jgi:hypothetical protein